MIIYEVFDRGDAAFYSNKKEAIADAKGRGECALVDEITLPKLSKSLLIAALNQREYALARRVIWRAKSAPIHVE